jgi:hypothetical protein
MNISHLAHDDELIRCTGCGTQFEVQPRVLCNPIRLVEYKEGIAQKHVCRAQYKVRPLVRVWREPSGEALDSYFSREMRRLMSA